MTNVERMKLAKENANKPQGENNKNGYKTEYVKVTSLFTYPKQGKTTGRIVGDFEQICTHELAPNKALMTRGVAPEGEFGVREGQIPYRVGCKNFDEATEVKVSGGCEWCKIRWRAHDLAEWETDEKKKKTLKAVEAQSKQKNAYYVKWIDRNDPYYIKKVKEGENWVEKKVKGYKILVVPKKAFNSIMAIMTNNEIDISDPEKGFDIEITKSGTKQETTYTVTLVMDKKTMAAKPTPLTDEEKGWESWNISECLYSKYDFQKIYPKLHAPYKQIFEIPDDKFKEMKDEHKKDKKPSSETTSTESDDGLVSSSEDLPETLIGDAGDAGLDEDTLPF